MHIGLIGGIGPAATQFYYRGLAAAFAAAGRPMELTMVHADLATLFRNVTAGDGHAQAAVYKNLTNRLKAAGATTVAITSAGGHFCIKEFEPISPLPVFNILKVITSELQNRGHKRIGLIGTRGAMTSGIFGALAPFTVVIPEGASLDAAHTAYIGMATAGSCSQQQRDIVFEIGSDLHHNHGAEIIVLGGTDLFLAFDGRACGFPTLDCAQVHIEALVCAAHA